MARTASLLLAACLVSQTHALSIATLQSSLRADPTAAQDWKALGKLLSDAGEFAEADLVFRAGAARCPECDELQHFERVAATFRGDDDGEPFACRAADFVSFDVPEPPAGLDSGRRVVHASKRPLVDKRACAELVAGAEAAAAARGWTTDRHAHAPTCDVPAHDLPPAAAAVARAVVRRILFPCATTLFPRLVDAARPPVVRDCFVIRYDADGDAPGFASLKPHVDESLVSFTVPLNERDEYDDGGLFVAPTGDLINGDAGSVLCFYGGVPHGGYPISRGTRRVLTAFLVADANASGQPPGYAVP